MTQIKEYLERKGISFTEKGMELLVKCIFSDCDSDSGPNEAHLYFSVETGQYQCKKCGEKGNLTTLRKHFGDDKPVYGNDEPVIKRNTRNTTPQLVDRYHKDLPARIRTYLNERGISNEVIDYHKIGFACLYKKNWITIPIKDIDGNYSSFKLRQDPRDGKDKSTWPTGTKAQIYEWNTLLGGKDKILITEGEMDALVMKSKGLEAITSTHGAGTAKQEWLQHFKPDIEYSICYDNDKAGKDGALSLAQKLYESGCKNIKIITLPKEVGEGGDLGDYVTKLNLPIEDLFTKYSTPYPEKIDVTQFKEVTMGEVCQVLNATIKKDDANKSVTFLGMLLTYTNESQINIFLNAPSSTGKSHMPLETNALFPAEDTIILAHCSPTAFFHEQGFYNEEKNEIYIDLSRKILIFTDMPDSSLMARLRPLLSHDSKETRSKITDKNAKGGNKTKTVVMVGYPSVFFCSAGMKVDEQETTRFIMLSPSIEHEKLLQGIKQTISKETDKEKFDHQVNSDPERILLKKRILGVRQENIKDVKINNPKLIEHLFLGNEKALKPRLQRDIKKVISFVKGFALLNLWFRKREGDYIWATEEDIKNGFELWNSISYGQDYGLSPYVYDIYMKIILPLWKEPSEKWTGMVNGETLEEKVGVSRKEILSRHFKVYGRRLSPTSLRQNILPQLEQVGLIIQERAPNGREMLVVPLDIEEEEEVTDEQ